MNNQTIRLLSRKCKPVNRLYNNIIFICSKFIFFPSLLKKAPDFVELEMNQALTAVHCKLEFLLPLDVFLWSSSTNRGFPLPLGRLNRIAIDKRRSRNVVRAVLADGAGFQLQASENMGDSENAYRGCVTASTSAGSPRLTTSFARRIAGPSSFGSVMGPSE